MEPIIEVKGLKKYFQTPRGLLHAVDDVTFSIERGKTLGVVGESGCGKSTLGRTIIHLLESTGGQIFLEGKDITNVKGKELKQVREKMQIIFQDPYSALDPHQNVREIMAEPIAVFENLPEKEMDERIVSLLEKVGMKADDMEKYAYEFSGGQRQRIAVDIQLNFALFKAGQFGFHDELVIFFSNVRFEAANGFFADKTVIKIRKWI